MKDLLFDWNLENYSISRDKHLEIAAEKIGK
jgi:hypothetical protein